MAATRPYDINTVLELLIFFVQQLDFYCLSQVCYCEEQKNDSQKQNFLRKRKELTNFSLSLVSDMPKILPQVELEMHIDNFITLFKSITILARKVNTFECKNKCWQDFKFFFGKIFQEYSILSDQSFTLPEFVTRGVRRKSATGEVRIFEELYFLTSSNVQPARVVNPELYPVFNRVKKTFDRFLVTEKAIKFSGLTTMLSGLSYAYSGSFILACCTAVSGAILLALLWLRQHAWTYLWCRQFSRSSCNVPHVSLEQQEKVIGFQPS